MGRDMLPPEQADSWGDYQARLEWEAADLAGLRSAAWRVVAALLFVAGLLFCAYAMTYRHWWLWLATLAAFTVVGVMAARAKANIDREQMRAEQLDLLDRAWQARVERGSPVR